VASRLALCSSPRTGSADYLKIPIGQTGATARPSAGQARSPQGRGGVALDSSVGVTKLTDLLGWPFGGRLSNLSERVDGHPLRSL